MTLGGRDSGEHGRLAEAVVEVLAAAGAFRASSRFWRLAESLSTAPRPPNPKLPVHASIPLA